MIAYNSQVNYSKYKEKHILFLSKKIKELKKELQCYGMSYDEINNISNSHEIYTSSYDIEKILLGISICELLWYNEIYKGYIKYKSSLQKRLIKDDTHRLDTTQEKRHYNTFLSAITLMVQKHGEELLSKKEND